MTAITRVYAQVRGGVRNVTFEHVAMAAVVAVGFVCTSGPISSNTMFVHMRTGMDMVRTGLIPQHDPYSFTAAGDPWIVQSWFAEWTYGILHRLTGDWHAVIYEQMVLSALAALGIALIAKSGSMVRTSVTCLLAIFIAVPLWSARPALFGVVCFTAVVYVVDRKRRLFWLVPIGWLWVNTHGSYLLGIAWLLFTMAGSWLDDRKSWREFRRPLVCLLSGLVIGAINPLGPKIFLFPLTAIGSRREIFRGIVEWGPPNFADPVGLVQLSALAVAILILFTRRVKWRYAVPAVVFIALGLLATRNIPLAALVLVPALREALANDVRPPRSSEMSKVMFVGASVALLLGGFVAVGRVATGNAFDFKSYPVEAINWMDEKSLLDATHRVAAQDVTGCFRILRDGSQKHVFIDDRYDMYPPQVSKDYMSLLRGSKDPEELLGRYNIDVVLWGRDQPLTNYLAHSMSWHEIYSDKKWLVFTR